MQFDSATAARSHMPSGANLRAAAFSCSTARLTQGCGVPTKLSQPRRTCAWSRSTVIGGSDVLPRRTFGAWPSDVVELADALRVEKFGVLGWSAGGPYAAVCAARIPARLTGGAPRPPPRGRVRG